MELNRLLSSETNPLGSRDWEWNGPRETWSGVNWRVPQGAGDVGAHGDHAALSARGAEGQS